jgi:hypothetical protein
MHPHSSRGVAQNENKSRRKRWRKAAGTARSQGWAETQDWGLASHASFDPSFAALRSQSDALLTVDRGQSVDLARRLPASPFEAGSVAYRAPAWSDVELVNK